MDHLMGYLKGTPQDRKARPPRNLRGEHFSDADMAGDPNDRISVTGFVSTIGGALVNYRSKKQAAIALSSSEAELYAGSMVCQDGLFIDTIVKELQPQAC